MLAAEVQGKFEDEPALREKSAWYLSRGVEVVWLLFPSERRLVVLTAGNETTLQLGQRVPVHPALPGLQPEVDELFEQIREG